MTLTSVAVDWIFAFAFGAVTVLGWLTIETRTYLGRDDWMKIGVLAIFPFFFTFMLGTVLAAVFNGSVVGDIALVLALLSFAAVPVVLIREMRRSFRSRGLSLRIETRRALIVGVSTAALILLPGWISAGP